MDIYSSSKNPKHRNSNKKTKKGNLFAILKEWFLSMSVRKRSIVIALIAFILVLVLVVSFILGYVAKLYFAYNHDDDFVIEHIEPISKDVTNIALFGLDTRTTNSFDGRSDSIMILSLNKKAGKVKVISVMRDSLVKVPGYDSPRKINTAYSLGGPELAVKTLNEVFGLDITEYASVNFYGMADIIDAVGGIEVNVLASELNATNGLNDNIKYQAELDGKTPQYVEKAGLQKLNGLQAVAWARIRSVATEGGESNDFGRTDRQRYVMEQLLNNVLKMNVSDYPSLIKGLLPYIKTSLSVSEIASLSTLITKDIVFEESRIPHNKYIINSNFSVPGVGSTVYYNLDYAKEVLLAYLYDEISPEDYMEQNGVNRKGWYKGSTSQSAVSSVVAQTSSKAESVQNNPEPSSPSTTSNQSVSNTTSSQPIIDVSSQETSSVENVASEVIDSSSQVADTEVSSEPASDYTSSQNTASEEVPVQSETEVSSNEQLDTEEPIESVEVGASSQEAASEEPPLESANGEASDSYEGTDDTAEE